MRKLFIGGFVISLLLFFSCKKVETVSQSQSSLANQALTSGGCSSIPIIDSMPNFDADADSIERPTILGNQRTNPYSLSNMRTAYNNLGYSALAVNATNLYVRFLPNSAQQLSILDSTLDAQNLEMFDAPIDYDVLQEGDYYQDPSVPDSLPTWQYAVVPTTFIAPAGITYQILSQIHIPADNYEAVETEAERLASRIDSINCAGGGGNAKSANPYVLQCSPGYHWDFTQNKCVCDCCPTGYHWDAGQQACVQDPPPPPPGVSPDAQIPAGMITVSDVLPGGTSSVAVRNVRVVAKRWFKIERVYTDNNGNFVFTKHFKHKAKVVVKFRNDNSAIKRFRVTRFWQMLYPIMKTIGVYSSNKNNIIYNFQKYNTAASDKGNLYWAAATSINAVIEYRNFASQEGIALPPGKLKIFLTRYVSGSGMTPMWNKRWYSGLPQEVAFTFFASQVYLPAAAVAAFVAVLKHEVDMAISYRSPNGYSTFYSDNFKTNVYHELTHAAHYAALGESWYGQFVNAEVNEIIVTFLSSNSPYGNGSNTNDSPIIALGESWAYHMGQYLADKQYGVASSCSGEQGTCYPNGYITGLNSHQIALENFDPGLTSDAFHWIPKGLFYDMMDTRNDATAIPRYVNLDDEVTGYKNSQFFSAFSSGITSLGNYEQNLIQLNPNNQTAQITSLFHLYGF